MAIKNTESTYGSVAKLLHWIIALFIIAILAIGSLMGSIENNKIADVLYSIHKSMGLTVLALMLIRVLWRFINPQPSIGNHIPKWQRGAAKASHFLLYALFVAMPINGWIMSTAAGHIPNYFWLFQLPAPGISHNKPFAHLNGDIHYILAWTVFAFIMLHIAAAIKHHVINKDNVLMRMMPAKK